MVSLHFVPYRKTKERIDRCILVDHPAIFRLTTAVHIDDHLWRICIFDGITTTHTGKAYFFFMLNHRHIKTCPDDDCFLLATWTDYINMTCKVTVANGVWVDTLFAHF